MWADCQLASEVHSSTPGVCALSTLLDSLVDVAADADGMSHSYVSYYATDAEMADRIVDVTRRATRDARALPQGRYHLAILSGVAAFYLSTQEARAAPLCAARRVLDELRPSVTPVYVTLRTRRWLKRSVRRTRMCAAWRLTKGNPPFLSRSTAVTPVPYLARAFVF